VRHERARVCLKIGRLRVRIKEPAAAWMNAFLAFFYPERCQVCSNARATPAQGYVCETCQSTVKLVTAPFCERCGRPYQGAITNEFVCARCIETRPCWSYARSAAFAQGALLDAIHLYKYRKRLCVEPFLAGLLVRQASPLLNAADWDCIVPVPLHPVKLRERDFNQAQRLARHLAKAAGLPLKPRLVKRLRPTPSQTLLRRDHRFDNVRGAFKARSRDCCEDLRVILIDDVFTTGATTNACAQALIDAGARAVCVWTVARGL
jgi:competence protein ComFC